MTLLEMIKDKKVTFQYYRDQKLWYETEDQFLFPVPISDIDGATFLKEDKAILFMKWISKYYKEVEKELETKDVVWNK